MNRKLRLQALRKRYDVDQPEIAMVLEISLSAYQKKERQEYEFKETEINLLLNYFNYKYNANVTYEEIFLGKC